MALLKNKSYHFDSFGGSPGKFFHVNNYQNQSFFLLMKFKILKAIHVEQIAYTFSI